MFPMTAAVNVPARASAHPQGGAGAADPRTALHGAGSLPTPTSPAPHHGTAPVIPFAAHHLPRRTYAKGEHLYDVGQEAAGAYLIEAGLVALTLGVLADRQRVVALVGPGDVVGALTPNTREHLCGAVALSGEVAVRVLPVVEDHSDENGNELATLLAAAAGAQIERLTNALEASAYPVPARIAHTLLNLGRRFGHHTNSGVVRLTLPITHETLASLVGAARETTTFTLQQLRQQGLLAGTRGKYQFEPEALARFAHEAALASR